VNPSIVCKKLFAKALVLVTRAFDWCGEQVLRKEIPIGLGDLRSQDL
jgi:hypothetical protein